MSRYTSTLNENLIGNMWNKRVAKFSSSNNQRFECSGTAESACHRPVSSRLSGSK